MAHGLVLASSTTPASGSQLRALGRVLIEGDMRGMTMGLQELRRHGGIVREDFKRLRNARDIENAQAPLIVQKRTAHDEPLVSKQLVHIPAMFPIKRLLTNRLPRKPARARGGDHAETPWPSFSKQRCASWYNALRSSPSMGGMRCWLPT